MSGKVKEVGSANQHLLSTLFHPSYYKLSLRPQSVGQVLNTSSETRDLCDVRTPSFSYYSEIRSLKQF